MAGFDLKLPEIPEEYGEPVIQVLKSEEDSVFEVLWRNGDDKEIVIRKAPGTDDISGVYLSYESEQKVTAGSYEITLKGDGTQVYLATWTNDGYTYSIYAEAGVSEAMMTQMAGEVR